MVHEQASCLAVFAKHDNYNDKDDTGNDSNDSTNHIT